MKNRPAISRSSLGPSPRSRRFCRSSRRFSKRIRKRPVNSGIRPSGSLSVFKDEHGFTGGYTIVKDAVRAWRQSRKEVFLPLTHRPGEAQVDYGFARVWIRGQAESTQVAMFVMTLPYSGAIFCQVFHRECTESFLEGHRRAFELFGGVPWRISYDNSEVAIAKIIGSRERKLTREFLRLQSHHLFEEHFCLVRRPNEKGHVEKLLDYARGNFLVPVPVVDSLEELNQQLAAAASVTWRIKAAASRPINNRFWKKNGLRFSLCQLDHLKPDESPRQRSVPSHWFALIATRIPFPPSTPTAR